MLLLIIICIVFFAALALPFRNWLEIKRANQLTEKWDTWLQAKPSLESYCKEHQCTIENPICDFCGSDRQLPSMEMVLINEPKFHIYNNKFKNYSHYKTYICAGCGSELFREKYNA